MSGTNRKPWFRKPRNTYYVTINGRQINLNTPDKAEANRKWHELMLQAEADSPISEAPKSVKTLLAEFCEWKEKNATPKTYVWYQRYLKSFVKTLPDEMTIEQLKPIHVTKWIDSPKAWKRGSVRGAIVIVKHAFRWCEEQGLITASPVRFMKRPAVQRRNLVLSNDQKALIQANVTDQAFKDLLQAAAETGARPQELTSVEARHFDRENNLWVFPASEHKTGKKTGKPRVIYLTPAMIDLSTRLSQLYPTGALFRNRSKKRWSSNAVRCRFRRLKETLGEQLPDGICLYTFRHTYATEALVNGIDPITVSELMGHSDANMLIKVYQHLSKKKEHMMAAALKAVSRTAG